MSIVSRPVDRPSPVMALLRDGVPLRLLVDLALGLEPSPPAVFVPAQRHPHQSEG